MEIALEYGGATLAVSVPDGVGIDEYAPKEATGSFGLTDFRQLFSVNRSAALVLEHSSPLVIVNDGFRSTPTSTILSWLESLDDSFIDRAHFLIATGAHSAPNELDLLKCFGRFLNKIHLRIAVHDATNKDMMRPVGKDQGGETVWLNKGLIDAEAILVIGSVEPHYFAGYTGGRKSLFPGLTDLATIERNHNKANSLKAMPLRLEGNPVAEHLDKLVELLSNRLLVSIQIVSDVSGKIASVAVGDLKASFEAATVIAKDIYSTRVSQRYSTVVCEVKPPLDRNLYQAQKALENCQAAVRDDGSLIIVSACNEGIGSEHFYNLASRWNRKINRSSDDQQHFGSHKLSRVVAIGTRINVFLHSKLPGDVVRHVFLEPLDNIEEFILSAFDRDTALPMAVVHDAGVLTLATPANIG